MIWKISIYLLFVALPASIITVNMDKGETKNKNGVAMVDVATNAEDENLPSDGAILGSVITDTPNSVIQISATDGEKTIKGIADENGEFFMNGFTQGNYTVTVVAENETDKQVNVEVFDDVEVRIGEVTELGTVSFTE